MTTLKERDKKTSLGSLCLLFGLTRQAYYQHYWYNQSVSFEQALLLKRVQELRARHPRMGTRKLYELLEPFILSHQIKLGRDALFDLLSANNLLVRRKKRSVRTTQSAHWLVKYPNLIRNLEVGGPNQLWVSDITYCPTGHGYLYISLIRDAYSRKIVGYPVSTSLAAKETLQALKMALLSVKGVSMSLIHHSDRGVQYCSKDYLAELTAHGIRISMRAKGSPLDNSIAERVNGILKQEYLSSYKVSSLSEGQKVLKEAVSYYNEERPHMSLGYMSPSASHAASSKRVRLWKNKYQDQGRPGDPP
ncbi:MAG: IS3 family transposase [Roseivirga sp.]